MTETNKAWKIGDDINTDEIISSEYYPRENLEELGQFALFDAYPDFAKNKRPGDVLIAGNNFGCGSSREYAPIALKHTRIKCIIAKSYARIFYRNAINIGLPIIISEEVYDAFNERDDIEVNLEKGISKNLTTGQDITTEPLPAFVMKIADSGGIVEYLKEHSFEELTR
ncbi:MAG: 3-isopropylmalate dehydratase small subunit [Nanoarchaeota archaeon]|nr:3-isopropylmalate dehydratase small subunit [Nanoarchaeota archaeon]